MKDSEILERIGQGDERILDHLYKKHFSMMLKIVLRNNGTEQEAKDIYQDALIAFWQKAASGKLVLTSKISTYLYSICQNLWLKELDRKSRLTNETHDEEDAQHMEEEENFEIVKSCIEELGETCKSILMYYYFDGLSMTDIAEKMGFANADTAKTKKYKCKKRLDNLIKDRYTRIDFFD